MADTALMLRRLQAGMSSDYDTAFYHHELAEALLRREYRALPLNTQGQREYVMETQKRAHQQVIQSQKNNEYHLYHPVVVHGKGTSHLFHRYWKQTVPPLTAMSRVHITYRRLPLSGGAVQYEVLSPDFSQGSLEERSLGVVTVHVTQRRYSFAPSILWCELQFVDINRLADGALAPSAQVDGMNYAARIHRAMLARIDEDEFR